MNETAYSESALHELQRDTFAYFVQNANPANGLVADNTRAGAPASIAIVGFALAAYTVGVERGFITRREAVERTLTTLRFFWNSPQGTAPDAMGYQGFFYHFLDMQTGQRVWNCELSTIDSTFLLAGALAAAMYFSHESPDESEIRQLADALYCRANWRWAQNAGATATHGWKPESGFLRYRWEGYDEALLLYVLGLASPTHALPVESYAAWNSTFHWRTLYGYDLLFAGPLFIHQFSHMWIDLRGIQDAFMRDKGIDYFENSRRATYAQQQYAIHNPMGFAGYNEHCWGLTASDGPGWTTRRVRGVERWFFDYLARGIPNGPDDGTLAPWAVVASLPFAPEIVLPTIQHCQEEYPQTLTFEGFKASFNPTFLEPSEMGGFWVCKVHFGLNQGPIVSMIENYRSGLLWWLMRQCPYLVTGLRRAGFRGGWVES
ncbi:MAG: glucoamylase family protein [Anaerolineae bacterium]